MFKHLFSNITYVSLEPTEITQTTEESDEKFLLSQFNPIYKWIARDEDGLLILFDEKPILIKPKKGKFKGQISWENFSKWHTINLFGHLFTDIKTTNPTLIEDYVKQSPTIRKGPNGHIGTKMKTLYLVNVDKNEDGYGVELYCAGIFDNREAAEERARAFEDADITEIELNSNTTDAFLGGYGE